MDNPLDKTDLDEKAKGWLEGVGSKFGVAWWVVGLVIVGIVLAVLL